ncbi:hypothetical protein [Pelistega ratti]|nr:hypothetical protein [Pelistega ratti]
MQTENMPSKEIRKTIWTLCFATVVPIVLWWLPNFIMAIKDLINN